MKFVNQILREGLQQGATDIHFEPLGQELRIRYRIDGVLHETPVPPRIKVLQDSVISRLKIMAGLDIAERRLPQDGRIALEHSGQPIDVRVATIPCVYGENVSLRLLGQERFDFMWEILGEGMLGYVLLIDASRPETLEEAASILDAFRRMARVPFVVALNRTEDDAELDERQVRQFLRLSPATPVVPCSALDKDSVKSVLLALLYSVLDEIEAEAANG